MLLLMTTQTAIAAIQRSMHAVAAQFDTYLETLSTQNNQANIGAQEVEPLQKEGDPVCTCACKEGGGLVKFALCVSTRANTRQVLEMRHQCADTEEHNAVLDGGKSNLFKSHSIL